MTQPIQPIQPAGSAASTAAPRLDPAAAGPEGPNVGPSPLEHLAAQGVTVEPGGISGRDSRPAAKDGTPAPPAPGHVATSPAEQELVDEQRARDRDDAAKASPPAAGGTPTD